MAHLSRQDAETYIKQLPRLLREVYQIDKPFLKGSTSADMNKGGHNIIDALTDMWVHLAGLFPDNHFNGMPSKDYIADYLKLRASWHAALAEPDGPGTGGTIVGQIVAGGLMDDLQNAISETALAIIPHTETLHPDQWLAAWKAASSPS